MDERTAYEARKKELANDVQKSWESRVPINDAQVACAAYKAGHTGEALKMCLQPKGHTTPHVWITVR